MSKEETTSQVFGLAEILQVLRRRWRWVAGGVLVILALALLLSLRQSTKYVGTARVLLRSTSAIENLDTGSVNRNLQPDRELFNAIEVITSSRIQQLVSEQYDGPEDPTNIDAIIATAGSDAVDVKVTTGDADESAELANLYAETYIDFTLDERTGGINEVAASMQQLQAQIEAERDQVLAPLNEVSQQLAADPNNAGLQAQQTAIATQISSEVESLDARIELYATSIESLQAAGTALAINNATLIDEAEPPSEPSSPKPVRDGVIGVMFGLAVGVVLAFAREFFDESIRTTDDLERVTKGAQPVLGVIPEADPAEASGLMDVGSHSPAAEAYRALRTSVRFAELDRPMKVIQITSGGPGEGKTTTVANLAVMLTQAGHRVAIADCDLRRPSIHQRFQEPVAPGLADVVLGERTLAEAVRQVNELLYVLPAGSQPPNPSELLGSSRAERVIMALAEEMDYVLIDTTPVLPVTDSVVVSRFSDATIVVVGAGLSRRHEVQRTLAALEQAGAPVIGVVFNRALGGDRNAYGYSYSYSNYGRAYGKSKKDDRSVPVGTSTS